MSQYIKKERKERTQRNPNCKKYDPKRYRKEGKEKERENLERRHKETVEEPGKMRHRERESKERERRCENIIHICTKCTAAETRQSRRQKKARTKSEARMSARAL